jgi:hypothetical protein
MDYARSLPFILPLFSLACSAPPHDLAATVLPGLLCLMFCRNDLPACKNGIYNQHQSSAARMTGIDPGPRISTGNQEQQERKIKVKRGEIKNAI